MRVLALATCVAFVAVSVATAGDIKLTNGEVLKDATITSHDAIGVTISHSAGVARISYTLLPPELRQKFNYDPEKAGEQAEAEAKLTLQSTPAEQAHRQTAVEQSSSRPEVTNHTPQENTAQRLQEESLNKRVIAVLSRPMGGQIIGQTVFSGDLVISQTPMSPDQKRVFERAKAVANERFPEFEAIDRHWALPPKQRLHDRLPRDLTKRRTTVINQLMSDEAFVRDTLK